MSGEEFSYISVNDDFDIENIDFGQIEKYDFSTCPDHLRPKILGSFLRYHYKKEIDANFPKTKKILSQNQYARMIGITPMTLSMYINGNRMPRFDNLGKLAGKFGQIIYEIIGVSGNINRVKNHDYDSCTNEMIELFISLKPEYQKELLQYAKILLTKSDN